MKVIFLDVDGVLNNYTHAMKIGKVMAENKRILKANPKDGMSMISYLDRKLQEIVGMKKVVTGIIIGSHTRKALTEACQKTMGQSSKTEETVNKFRGVLLIEDGDHTDRLEVISGYDVVMPVDSGPLNLKKVRGGLVR